MEGKRLARVLYITYDGLTDPLGRSQVLPYLVGCASRGHHITILSCEKRDRFCTGKAPVMRVCNEAGLDWWPLRYHRRPPVISSIYDAWRLTTASVALHRRCQFELVHSRSYIPSIAALHLKRLAGLPLLFDMRGFWPEERIEGGSWDIRNPLYARVYRYFKRLETRLLQTSDHIIALSEAGKTQLLSRPALADRTAEDISVIPCAVDFEHFRLARSERATSRQALGISADAAVLVYIGSLGSWYMLDEMLDYFRAFQARHNDAYFLFVTMEPSDIITTAARTRGLDLKRIIIRAATREELPKIIASADAGISFIKPVFSKTASCPTKLGEMLASGLPVVSNTGVGDVETILQETGAGAVIREFNEDEYRKATYALEAMNLSPLQIRRRARAFFDLKTALKNYSAIYESLEQKWQREGALPERR